MSEHSELGARASNERLLTADEIKRLMEAYRIRGTLNSSLANLMQECAQRGFDKANTHETSEQQPVAWYCVNGFGEYIFTAVKPPAEYKCWAPLYSEPRSESQRS